MAKIYGVGGKITGKQGNNVYAVRSGVTILKTYNPVVYNPNTSAQVAQRAKFKLLSQLGAVLGPYIAIPKSGMASKRNLFVKKNYGQSTYENNTADIVLAKVQLTSSVVGMPEVFSKGRTQTSWTVAIRTGAGIISRVVYVVLEKDSDSALHVVGTQVVSTPGADEDYAATFTTPNMELVVLAYTVRDNTEAARVVFGNLEAVTAETVAKLITSRVLLETDVTVSETRGVSSSAASE